MKTVKVVYNACFGGFSLSAEARALYREKTGKDFDEYKGQRHDPALVAVVEELGEAANTSFSNLKISTVAGPYRIDEYDGTEGVATPDSDEWVTP